MADRGVGSEMGDTALGSRFSMAGGLKGHAGMGGPSLYIYIIFCVDALIKQYIPRARR